ncbi:hypothetical protein IAT38_003139 [Cryptococcus sp. DSM 104549]
MSFFQSLSSFFSGTPSASSSSRHAHRQSVMNSTIDAFSLPTTSGNAGMRYGNGYSDGPHLDSASSSPGPSRRGSNAAYAGGGAYPPSKDGFAQNAAYYPPLTHTFHRLRNALSGSFPELLETLNSPVNPHLLAAFEAELGCPLPRAVRESLLVADGQDFESTSNIAGSGGLFYGLYFLPLEEVMREWAFWRHAELDPAAGTNAAVLATMASVPPHWIRSRYACKGWVPLLSDRTGNYVGVDLDPGANGAWGQVIVFGRDFDRKCVLWRGDGEGGWGKWLAAFVEELESGEGWEADKTSSSDEEEDIGYSSYNGGASYGESGSGLRLAGEYRGWNVLEAWWDRSVRRWEGLGLGLDIEEVERGMEEARRLTGYTVEGKGKGRADGLAVGTKAGDSPVNDGPSGSPNIPAAPGTPVPRDSDVLLPPSSPEQPPIPKIRHPAPSPVRVITPITTTTDHPLKPSTGTSSPSGYLSPPSRSPPRRKRDTAPAPAVGPLDLPTRADVQAMSAIAQAENSGLRGGWVMNLDTSAGAAGRRASAISTALSSLSSGRPSVDAEMVDIDLEGGKVERFGSPQMSEADIEKQREEEKLALAGLEHRRSPQLPNQVSRTPSPLSREASFDEQHPEKTPKAAARSPYSASSADGMVPVPASVLAATSSVIRPPPAAAAPQTSPMIRTFTPEDERDRPIIRAGSSPSSGHAPAGGWDMRTAGRSNSATSLGRGSAPGGIQRTEREASVMSTDSHDGLLDRRERSSSPAGSVLGGDGVVASPTAIRVSHGPGAGAEEEEEEGEAGLTRGGTVKQLQGRNKGLEEELEEVTL